MEAFVLKLAQLVLIFLAVVKADMTFYAVGVGQGESCIIQCPNQKDLVIVDMGATGPKYVTHEYIRYLLKEKFHAAESGKRIHVLVTHSHVDHYNYIDKVFDRYLLPNVQEVILGGRYEDYKDMQIRNWLEHNIRNLYSINNQEKCFGNSDCALTPTWTRYAAYIMRKLFQKGGIAGARDPWQFCGSSDDVEFTVLGANIANRKKDANGKSVILKVRYNSWSILMSGDFENVNAQKELMSKWKWHSSIFKANYYKAAHHGAWTRLEPNYPKLLSLIRPQKVYISHGYPALSKYHHPNSTTIDHLIALNSIVTIDPNTNKPFVYWNSSKLGIDIPSPGCTTTLTTGMNKAIYETCRVIDSQNKQVCQDIRISTNGKTDKTSYEDVPKKYVNKNSKGITKLPFLCNA